MDFWNNKFRILYGIEIQIYGGNRNELAAAALFYQYLSEKNDDFLQKNNYSKEEVLDGINQIMQKAGYKDLVKVIE